MLEINLDRLRELAGYLRNAVRELRAIGQTPKEVWLLDARSINSAKYLLIVAAEAALDICNHLAARKGGPESGRLCGLHRGSGRDGHSR